MVSTIRSRGLGTLISIRSKSGTRPRCVLAVVPERPITAASRQTEKSIQAHERYDKGTSGHRHRRRHKQCPYVSVVGDLHPTEAFTIHGIRQPKLPEFLQPCQLLARHFFGLVTFVVSLTRVFHPLRGTTTAVQLSSAPNSSANLTISLAATSGPSLAQVRTRSATSGSDSNDEMPSDIKTSAVALWPSMMRVFTSGSGVTPNRLYCESPRLKKQESA